MKTKNDFSNQTGPNNHKKRGNLSFLEVYKRFPTLVHKISNYIPQILRKDTFYHANERSTKTLKIQPPTATTNTTLKQSITSGRR